MLLGSGNGHQYTLLFENGGQLVQGNEVLVAGEPIGLVDGVELTDDNQAAIPISVDRPLREGTTAVIRATSLSGVANHYVSLTLGPDNAPELPEDATLDGAATTTPVDLDQLFNTFTPQTRRSLKNFFKGNAAIYAGRGEEANATYHFLPPALSSTDRLLAELVRDQRVFTDFLIDSSRVVTAVADRESDLEGLVSNSNEALGAIAGRNRSFDAALQVLAPTLREANTSFVNLRAALDDLDPLVETSKVATRDLTPFLQRLRPVVNRAVPVFTDLSSLVSSPGEDNDLAELLPLLGDLQRQASDAGPRIIDALNDLQPTIEFARPYAPDILAAITKLGQATAYYDANGHYARVQPVVNLFEWNSGTGQLDPTPPSQQFDNLEFEVSRRCPGAATQPAADGSSPFLDGGALGAGDCDPTDLPPGP